MHCTQCRLYFYDISDKIRFAAGSSTTEDINKDTAGLLSKGVESRKTKVEFLR